MALDGKGLPEKSMFPTRTAGSGRVRPNSARTGAGQGRGSNKLMVSCRQCGFVFDKKKVNQPGGDLQCKDGYGPVTKTAGDTVYDAQESGTAIAATEGTGDATVKKNRGCPMCGTLNGTGGA